jgi:uncharacterized membrane protein YdbT with pleckstrin-like domain
MSSFSQNLMKDEKIVLSAAVSKVSLIKDFVLMFLMIGFLTIWGTLIKIFTTQLVLTSNRLYGKVGLIKTKTLDTPLNKINNVSVSSGLFGKLLGYGTLSVTSSSGLYEYKYIKSPDAVRNAIMNEIEQFDQRRIQKQAEQMAAAINNRSLPV